MDEAGSAEGAANGGLAKQTAFRRAWDTADVRTQERFSYFREAMCQTYLACTPLAPANGEIAALIEVVALKQGEAARATTSPARLTRTPADLKNISDK